MSTTSRSCSRRPRIFAALRPAKPPPTSTTRLRWLASFTWSLPYAHDRRSSLGRRVRAEFADESFDSVGHFDQGLLAGAARPVKESKRAGLLSELEEGRGPRPVVEGIGVD